MIINNKKVKVALVHDHLAQDGGAELVLKIFSEIFPEAPIYTLIYEKAVVEKNYPQKNIQTSIIQKLPGGLKHYKWYLPFMPMAVEFFDFSEYDLVISDASAFAKGIITKPETLHICYCHTPTRFIWSDTHSYINELKYNKFFKKIISLVLNYIRIWDRLAADRVDFFIANSKFISHRIKKYYKSESVVIYPPVETEKFYISPEKDNYFLIGGRLAPYKRIDIAIEAFNKLRDENYKFRVNDKIFEPKLKIYGDGIDLERLKQMANGNEAIEFLGRVSDEEKANLYSKCLAFLNPQQEDFGITAVEALSSGVPVIAYASGGALEIIEEGKSGIFFKKQSAECLIEAIKSFDLTKFDPVTIKKQAEKFNVVRFKKEILDFVLKMMEVRNL